MFVEITQLILVLAAALLAIESGVWKNKRPTRAFWIASVACLSFVFGCYGLWHKQRENQQLRELARDELRPKIVAITESDEVKNLFKYRGASQDVALVTALHKRIKSGREDLNVAANRHIGNLSIDERAKLIWFISALATIDEFMERYGYTDLIGSGARLKMMQARDKGVFDLLK